jgi:Putative sensor
LSTVTEVHDGALISTTPRDAASVATGWHGHTTKEGCVIVTTSELRASPGATPAPSRSPRVRWWRLLFSADTRKYLGVRIGEPAPGGTAGRVLAHTVLSLPLNLVSLALTVYLWLLVPANLAYPLRPGTVGSYQHSWGGSSLAGAWAVHAAAGVVALFAPQWVVRGITWLQGRLTRRLLGAD